VRRGFRCESCRRLAGSNGVQAVDVLRYDPRASTSTAQRQVCQCHVGGVRLACTNPAAPPVIPLPDQTRVTGERRGRRELLGTKGLPKPFRPAERWNAGFRADSRTGEHENAISARNYVPRMGRYVTHLPRDRPNVLAVIV
jgi:hypothetical protein